MADLANPALDTLEEKRAKEIDALLGPKSAVNPKADFVIDMHNTTANTGVRTLVKLSLLDALLFRSHC